MNTDPMPTPHTSPVLALRSVGRVIDGTALLSDIDWEVRQGQHWAVLGPNGSGKTTLVRIASMWAHPSSGDVELLGHQLGRTDVRRLRMRVGFASAAMADRLRPELTATEVVMTAKHAALEPWWHSYSSSDRRGALLALKRMGCEHRAGHRFGALSSGERQRVLLARALSTDPCVVLLDEPNAGLDLTGREDLIAALNDLAADPHAPPLVLVTHHTEEIPDGFTHCLLMRAGTVFAQGRIDAVLTAETLSSCFGLRLDLERRHGRWTARAVRTTTQPELGSRKSNTDPYPP